MLSDNTTRLKRLLGHLPTSAWLVLGMPQQSTAPFLTLTSMHALQLIRAAFVAAHAESVKNGKVTARRQHNGLR